MQGQQIGRYHLLMRLGRGGMGEVFLAEDERIGQKVAIKLVRNESSDADAREEDLRLFQREATAIARLDHPNILPLYDYGEQALDGAPFSYLVMPYRPEGSLTDWLRRRSGRGPVASGGGQGQATPGVPAPLSPRDIAHIITQAADALQHAHERHILHQDVKPSNFLIRDRKEHPNLPDLLLADFGIARIYAATSNMSQHVRGTPAYMAPEQWEGRPVPASDQYALAIMAYQLLVGHPPFQGRLEQVMHQHFNVQPPAPSTLNPHLPKDVDIVLLHALAKRPEQRFATITAFARAFQQALVPADGQESRPLPVVDVSRPPVSGGQTPVMPTPSQSGGISPVLHRPPDSGSPLAGGHETGGNIGTPGASTPAAPLTPQFSLPPSTLHQAASGDLFTTLAITPMEAMHGTTRTLNLAPGRYVNVTVPPGAYEGQMIRLEHQGPSSSNSSGTLILRLTIKAHDDAPGPFNVPPPPPPPTVVMRDSHAIPSPSLVSQMRGLSTGRKILLAVLALLIIIVGISAIFTASATSAYVADSNATATSVQSKASSLHATTSSFAATQTADNTSITLTDATATAQTAANATATVLARAPAPYGGTLVLDDPLKDNQQGHRWLDYSNNDRACQFVNGSYLARQTQLNFSSACAALNTDFANFALQVKMTILDGDDGGVLLRSNSAITQGYYISISANGLYGCLLVMPDSKNSKALKSNIPIPGFHTGPAQSNLLAVVARGNSFDLYVNQRHVDTFVDGTFTHGPIGLTVGSTNQVTQVTYNDLKVWKL